MARTATSFRVGRVQGYQRGKVWYLCYFEQGQRKRPRVGSDRDAARTLAAQTNAQITVGAPGVLSFEPVAIAELRQRWLNHHEQVLRSSVSSIRRYRAATDHLLEFGRSVRKLTATADPPVKKSDFPGGPGLISGHGRHR